VPVTIVSTDRTLLRELSWTLSLFGYRVTASCDFSDESPWRRSPQAGLILIDARSGDEVNDVLAMPRSPGFTYRMVIDGAGAAERLLLAGADDVLRHPVNAGELLTRLRAGVRRLEFERRLTVRGRRDATTGMLTHHALLRELDSARDSFDAGRSTCVVCGIDFLHHLREQYGSHAVRHLTATLARCLGQSIAEGELCAMLGDSTFVAILRRPVDDAIQFAQSLTTDFAACDTLAREIRALPSLSAIVAEWNPAASPAEQLDSNESIFEHAQSYGGNHIGLASDLQQEIATWRANMDAGVPFEDVIAQDMMELFPVVFTSQQMNDGCTSSLAALPHLRVPCIPVVDDSGELAGELRVDPLGGGQPLFDESPSTTVQHNLSLSELFETFHTAQSEYLVVVDGNNHPVGYLTCEALASLVLDRIDASNYCSPAFDETSIAWLIVPVESTREESQASVSV
jgi:GGDEF domain-containing protein